MFNHLLAEKIRVMETQSGFPPAEIRMGKADSANARRRERRPEGAMRDAKAGRILPRRGMVGAGNRR
jgi:hypothetical protein